MKNNHKESKADDNEDDKLGKFLGKLATAFVGFLAQEIKFDFKSDGSLKAKAPLFDIKGEQLGTWRIEGENLLLKFEGEEDDGTKKTVKLRFEIINITSKQLVLKAEEGEDHLYLKVKSEE